MEDIDLKIEIPPQYSAITTASTIFVEVVNSLDFNQTEVLVKHLLIYTKRGDLIDIVKDKVTRLEKLNLGNIASMFVHCEYEPSYTFIILVYEEDYKAYALDFNTLQTVAKWEDVFLIESKYDIDLGKPQLQLTNMSGSSRTISYKDILSTDCDGNMEISNENIAGMTNVYNALSSKVECGLKHLINVQNESKIIESSIYKEIDKLLCDTQEKSTWISKDTESTEISDTDTEIFPIRRINQEDFEPISIQLIKVDSKILHDKWVICITVQNISTRKLVCNLDVNLNMNDGNNTLKYKTKVIKLEHKNINKDNEQIRVTQIKPLASSILRPNKTCYILGICDIPKFTNGLTVECSGSVVYKTKNLSPTTEGKDINDEKAFHVTFEPVKLSADDISSTYVHFDANNAKFGPTLSSIVLIGSNEFYKLELKSKYTSLNEIYSNIKEKCLLIKVPGLTNVFCMKTEESRHPLHMLAFSLEENKFDSAFLSMWARNDKQAVVFIHFLKSLLPSDFTLNELNECDHKDLKSAIIDKYKDLMNHLCSGLEKFSYQYTNEVNKVPKLESESTDVKQIYNKDKEILRHKFSNIEVNGEEYFQWKTAIQKLELEMDEMYIDLNKMY